MVRNADSIENAIGPKWPGGQYAYGFGGTDEPQRSQRTQSVSCGRRGSGSTDTPIRQYVWGAYIDECIQLTTFVILGNQNLEPGSYYLLQDLLYRAVALTNSGGGIVEAYDTDAYGNSLIFIEPGSDGRWFTDDDVQSDYGANEIIYCGYRFDSETQNYYVRNRAYNPVLGRWIQRDPIGYEGGINLYEYVESGPEMYFDPLGFTAVPMPGPYTGPNPIGSIYPEPPPEPIVTGGAAGATAIGVVGSLLVGWWYYYNQATVGEIANELANSQAQENYIAHQQWLLRQAKCKKPKGECLPCIPPVGTVGYRWDIVPPSKPHDPIEGDHLNLYIMQQLPPPLCKCKWNPPKRKADRVVPPPPAPGWVPIAPAQGGGIAE